MLNHESSTLGQVRLQTYDQQKVSAIDEKCEFEDTGEQAIPENASKCSKIKVIFSEYKKPIIIVGLAFLVLGITLGIVLPLVFRQPSPEQYGVFSDGKMSMVEIPIGDESLKTVTKIQGQGVDVSVVHNIHDIRKQSLDIDLQISLRQCGMINNQQCYLLLIPVDTFTSYLSQKEEISPDEMISAYNQHPKVFIDKFIDEMQTKLLNFSARHQHKNQQWKLEQLKLGQINQSNYVDISYNQTAQKFNITVFNDEQAHTEITHTDQIPGKQSGTIDIFAQLIRNSIRELRIIILKLFKAISVRNQQLDEQERKWLTEKAPESSDAIIDNCYTLTFDEGTPELRCRVNQISQIIPNITNKKLPQNAVITQVIEVQLFKEITEQ